jgi:C_GCAxxG_C_C family probable redox protein
LERKKFDKTNGLINRNGNQFNCCESTLLIVNDKHPLPDFGPDIMRVASLTGGGVCYQGSACGAVVGMATALGLVYGTTGDESPEEYSEKREKAQGLLKPLLKEFRDKFGSVNCKDLMGLDFTVEEDMVRYREMRQEQNRTSGLDRCDGYIDWTAKRVLETLGEG